MFRFAVTDYTDNSGAVGKDPESERFSRKMYVFSIEKQCEINE